MILEGELVLDAVPLWNDKRELVTSSPGLSNITRIDELLRITANPPASAWQAFKLAWIKRIIPEAYRRAATLLMPKDYINFKLTNQRAIHYPEASCSFLFSYQENGWSRKITETP